MAIPSQKRTHLLFKFHRRQPPGALPSRFFHRVLTASFLLRSDIFAPRQVPLVSRLNYGLFAWKDTPFQSLTHFQFPQLLTLAPTF